MIKTKHTKLKNFPKAPEETPEQEEISPDELLNRMQAEDEKNSISSAMLGGRTIYPHEIAKAQEEPLMYIDQSASMDDIKSELKEPTFKKEKSGKIISTNSPKRKK